MPKWSKEFPTKEGIYWFYGYRYGKVSCGYEQQKEYALVKVRKTTNAYLYVSEGTFMFESEVEDPNFTPAFYPEPPT